MIAIGRDKLGDKSANPNGDTWKLPMKAQRLWLPLEKVRAHDMAGKASC